MCLFQNAYDIRCVLLSVKLFNYSSSRYANGHRLTMSNFRTLHQFTHSQLKSQNGIVNIEHNARIQPSRWPNREATSPLCDLNIHRAAKRSRIGREHIHDQSNEYVTRSKCHRMGSTLLYAPAIMKCCAPPLQLNRFESNILSVLLVFVVSRLQELGKRQQTLVELNCYTPSRGMQSST